MKRELDNTTCTSNNKELKSTTTINSTMKLCCIFIVCLSFFALCSLASSQFSQGPDKCCFSFSNIRIPVKQIESYHTTHLTCRNNGVIFITKAGRDICADPNERWVQRLRNLLDARSKDSAYSIKKKVFPSKRKESVITTEITTSQTTEDTSHIYLEEAQLWSAQFCIEPGREQQ